MMAKEPNNKTRSGGAKAGSSTEGIEVVAKREVFYRAGLEFGHVPKQVALDSLTKQQLADILAEPMLIVREVEIVPAANESANEPAQADETLTQS